MLSVCMDQHIVNQMGLEDFYNKLRTLVGSCKSHEELVILGDFNARVGIREARSGTDPDEVCDASDFTLGPLKPWNWQRAVAVGLL